MRDIQVHSHPILVTLPLWITLSGSRQLYFAYIAKHGFKIWQAFSFRISFEYLVSIWISLLVLLLTFVYENIMKISRLKHRKWKKMKTFSNPILVVGNAGSSGTGLCYRFCKRKQFLTIYDFRFRLGKPKKSCYCRKNVS